MNTLLIGELIDPWHNLALEELLFDTHSEGVNLYLWQNQNTVVIGRHQNAWKECRVEELEQDGGKLARRTSGGGAVFHDLGNLNFTFTATKTLYDQQRQLRVIIDAVQSLGIAADFTGRNDIVTANGEKFSGNAFRFGEAVRMHHGTLLVCADMGKLGRYLQPSAEKLRAKGVESVRARVCNLADYRPSLGIDEVRDAVIRAFIREYGVCRRMEEDALDMGRLAALRARHASWDWRYGSTPGFDLSFETRFPWGGVELQMVLENGRIREARVYSDAMDEAFIAQISPALIGQRFDRGDMAKALRALRGEMAVDMADWLLKKDFDRYGPLTCGEQ